MKGFIKRLREYKRKVGYCQQRVAPPHYIKDSHDYHEYSVGYFAGLSWALREANRYYKERKPFHEQQKVSKNG